MNEFDDLLNDVLRQDGTQKPPPGMRERIRGQWCEQKAV
jgi:hypothetical protein